MQNRVHYFLLSLVAVCLAFSGCSKKQDQSAVNATSSAAPVPTGEVAAAPAPDAAPQAPTGPGLDTSQMEGDAKRAMAEADAALKQREYEKAVRTMMAIQQAQLNAQQAQAAHQQMIALQKNLANAAASGNQSAIAAGELLRAAHSH